MATLIVTAHPDPDSLTHRCAERLRERLATDGASVADLAQEGFDPRFTLTDRRAYTGDGAPAADVLAEQDRIDTADHLVLVFPVFWWSLPALLKGWVDRVFVAGWAFSTDDAGTIVPALQRLTVHLLPVSGTSRASFARHGYTESFATQVERGILGFCGTTPGVTAFLHDAEDDDRAATAASVETATAAIAAAVTGGASRDARVTRGAAGGAAG